jgi:hypothetical protein
MILKRGADNGLLSIAMHVLVNHEYRGLLKYIWHLLTCQGRFLACDEPTSRIVECWNYSCVGFYRYCHVDRYC